MKNDKKKVLFLVNHDVVIYNFRLEIVEYLISKGYEVHISSPFGKRINDLINIGANWHSINLDRHSLNPIKDIKVLVEYNKLCKKINPDIILTFTIKPNIYGSIIANKNQIPIVANITGLGNALGNEGWKQTILIFMYKFAFKNVQRVFFQNKEDQLFFLDKHIAMNRQKLIPGSGVNIDRFPLRNYPIAGDGRAGAPVKFAFISRIMKEKGIDQYLQAALTIKKEYPATEFHICGFCENEYVGELEDFSTREIVIYHGMINNVSEFLNDINCVIHPSFYPEGLSNILLEACSTGRPVITTDRAGCREVVDDGINGYLVPEKDSDRLITSIQKFLSLNNESRSQMGISGRIKIEREFNRKYVVEAYMDEVYAINE